MGERRYLIATGVTAGLTKPESKRLIRTSVDAMVSVFTQLFGYERTNILGIDPTAQEMRDGLRQFCAEREPDDVVVLYHIGHASIVLEEHRLWMGDARDKHTGTLRTADIAALILDDTPLRRTLIILESCHAGQGAGEALLTGMRMVKQRQSKSLAFLTAAHPAEQIRPGDFVRLFEDAVRSPPEGERELSLNTIAETITKNPRRPQWQTVTPSGLFVTEDDLRFFPTTRPADTLEIDLDLLTRTERTELSELLLAVRPMPRPGQLAELVQAASTFLGPVPTGGIIELFSYVERLEQAFTPAGRVPPLLAFLEFLAARVGAPHNRLLRAFVRRVAVRLQVSRKSLSELTAAAGASSTVPFAPAYLVISAERDRNPDRYVLSTCLYLSEDGLPDKREDSSPCTESQLQERGESLLEQAGTWLTDIDPGLLTVEFLLPLRLLGQPVDRWRVGVGTEAETTLGIQCIVVVRPIDRPGRGWGQSDFRNRWTRLRATDGLSGAAQVRWLHRLAELSDPSAGDIVVNGLDRDKLFAIFGQCREVVCVALSYAYEPISSSDVDGLAVALSAGVPAALWRRDGGDVTELRATLNNLILDGTLNRLPHKVLDFRLAAAAAGASDHYGRHLTLLWDDAHRQAGIALRAPVTTPGSA